MDDLEQQKKTDEASVLAVEIVDLWQQIALGVVDIPQDRWDLAWGMLITDLDGRPEQQGVNEFMEFLSTLRETA